MAYAQVTSGQVYANSTLPVLSPLKQLKSGIAPNEISCKTGFVLVIKSEDSSPACVMPSSSARLLAQGWITPEKFLAQRIPSPKSYLGAAFTSSGTVFPLIQGMPLNIPQSAAIGYFSFLFSTSYLPDIFSVSYQSCTRILNSEIQQNCDLAKSLDFSFGKNSQGQYAVTTKSITLPCGSLQSYHGGLIPTKYYYAIFSIKTLNFTTAAPFSYGYTVYANC